MRAKITAEIREVLPESTNVQIRERRLSRDLGDKLWEARWKQKGGAPRVIWFYEDAGTIVITHGFAKKSPRTPPGEIDRARRARDEYLDAKKIAALVEETYEQFIQRTGTKR